MPAMWKVSLAVPCQAPHNLLLPSAMQDYACQASEKHGLARLPCHQLLIIQAGAEWPGVLQLLRQQGCGVTSQQCAWRVRVHTATVNLQGMWCCRFVGGLSGLHTYFTSNNKSTYEHFRSRAGSHENPYNVNCMRNWQQVPLMPLLVTGTLQADVTGKMYRHPDT